MKLKTGFSIIKKTFKHWLDLDPFAKSAIIAYYALFSLPSLLLIVIWVSSIFFGREAVQGHITSEFSGLIGSGPAEAIESMITSASINSNSTLNIVISASTLLFGATGVFYQLQKTLNIIFEAAEDNTNFKKMVVDRLISFGMIMAIGFLLIISLIISAGISVLNNYLKNYFPEITVALVSFFNFIISLTIITVLFAAVYRFLPNRRVRWKTAFIGAIITTLLFLLGKTLLGYYFGQTAPASVYGGASSVVLILLWVYYTGLIFFMGAEFTMVYSEHQKNKKKPVPAVGQEQV
ncbi:YihY/virulence factor BrkB family protein [Galbibacter pacificus]|uniref:YihY/virulence factor BrkB family protein n=1 Tax=Galbibacter pacificus TaxID=2996052 RepID=A0ABT6FQ96_9FLAO|nr:YihY/virulence factor BrkB family protein [Galbibacter pacificus]MDG3582096.1 YihY/virulence factor BrkB family protein [Galbibacter pacificus]MDG3585428.1 YihY/virulence factor BrkB family protein [Galbibacter pacificus]